MGSVSVRVEDKGVKDFIKKLSKLPDKIVNDRFVKIGQLVRGSMVDRTISGKGVKGAIKKYSDGYKAMRASRGYSTKPNYTLSGQMLQSSTVIKIKDGVKIGFRGKHTKSIFGKDNGETNAEIAFKLDNRSEFWGVGNKEIKVIDNELGKLVNAL